MSEYADKVRAILARRGITRDSVREGLKKTGLFHEKPIYTKPDYEEGDPVMGGILGSGEGRPRPQAFPQPAFYEADPESTAPKSAFGKAIAGVGPKQVKMHGGEYVLPKNYVDAVGGPEVLDQHVMQTLGNVTPPDGNPQKGYRRGGSYQYYGDGMEPGPIDQNPDFGPPSTIGRGSTYGGRNGRFDPTSVQDNPFSTGELDPRMGAWFGGIARQNPFIGIYGPSGPAGYNPPPGLPGASQGPTQIPSYFDPQGYPWATPNTSDIPQGGYGHHHTPPKSDS
jgi:hypothetical protein